MLKIISFVLLVVGLTFTAFGVLCLMLAGSIRAAREKRDREVQEQARKQMLRAYEQAEHIRKSAKSIVDRDKKEIVLVARRDGTVYERK